MTRDLSRERELVNGYHTARLLFELAPDDTRALIGFRLICSDVKAHLMSTGQPLHDFGRGTQLQLDSNLEIQELPLGADRFRDWIGHGAASLGRRVG